MQRRRCGPSGSLTRQHGGGETVPVLRRRGGRRPALLPAVRPAPRRPAPALHGRGRLHGRDASAAEAAAGPAPPPQARRRRMSANASLIAGVGTLVLAIGRRRADRALGRQRPLATNASAPRPGDQGAAAAAKKPRPPPTRPKQASSGGQQGQGAKKAKRERPEEGSRQQRHEGAEEVLKPSRRREAAAADRRSPAASAKAAPPAARAANSPGTSSANETRIPDARLAAPARRAPAARDAAAPRAERSAPPTARSSSSTCERRRDQLVARVAELQWDLGGLVYEMAIRNASRSRCWSNAPSSCRTPTPN